MIFVSNLLIAVRRTFPSVKFILLHHFLLRGFNLPPFISGNMSRLPTPAGVGIVWLIYFTVNCLNKIEKKKSKQYYHSRK
jgi:hypothetical protein